MSARAYNARHAEFLPDEQRTWRYLYEPEWNEDASAEQHAQAVRHFAREAGLDPEQVDALLREMGEDVVAYYIIVVDDEARAEAFEGQLRDIDTVPSGDDTTYDYWPSGVRLAWELAWDDETRARVDEVVARVLAAKGLTRDELF